MKRIDETHSFSIAIAAIIGIEKAIILKDMRGICIHNMSNDKHIHGGRAWMFNSARALAEKYPYMSQRSIARWLDELERDKWIESGNFNNQGFDRTKWYSVDLEKYAETIHQYMNQNGESICQNGQCSSQNGESTGQDGEPYHSQYHSQNSLSNAREDEKPTSWSDASEQRVTEALHKVADYLKANPSRWSEIKDEARVKMERAEFWDNVKAWIRWNADNWPVIQHPVKALTSGRSNFVGWLMGERKRVAAKAATSQQEPKLDPNRFFTASKRQS